MVPPDLQKRAPQTREEALRDFRTDQIMAAARRVIGAVGWPDASIDKIAEDAGVARSTVYVYFDGRDDLLNQCLAQNRIGLSERVREAVQGADGFESGLQAFLEAILVYVGEYRAFFAAIMQVRGLDPFFRHDDRPATEVDSIRVEVQAILADLLKQGLHEGLLDEAAMVEATRVMGSMIYGSLMWRVNDPEPVPAADEARSLARTLLFGIARTG